DPREVRGGHARRRRHLTPQRRRPKKVSDTNSPKKVSDTDFPLIPPPKNGVRHRFSVFRQIGARHRVPGNWCLTPFSENWCLTPFSRDRCLKPFSSANGARAPSSRKWVSDTFFAGNWCLTPFFGERVPGTVSRKSVPDTLIWPGSAGLLARLLCGVLGARRAR